ncbi:hypothetical protein D3C80_2064050 [compost metagenome]
MQQITMGCMDLDHLEACGQRALGRIDKSLNDRRDLTFIQLLGLGVLGIESNR